MSPLLSAVVDIGVDATSFRDMAERLLEGAARVSSMRAGLILIKGSLVASRHLSDERIRFWANAPLHDFRTDDFLSFPLAGPGGPHGLLVVEGKEGPLPADAIESVRFIAGTLAVAARAHSHSVFDAGPVVVFRWKNSAGWPVEAVSENVLTQFGWPVSTLVAAPFAPLVHPDDLERVGAEVALATEKGQSYFAQHYRLRTASGAYRWVFDATQPVRNQDGQVTHFEGYLIDDTARVDAEAARKALELELRNSQKLQAVGTLASGLAHEFNNLLATIVAHAELARRRGEPSPEDLEEVLAAAARGREVVRQLLSFSHGDSQKQSPLRVQAVVEEALRLLRAGIPSSVRIERRLDGHAPTVRGNANQLQQVVLNLAMTALRGMPQGGVITVVVDTIVLGSERPVGALRPGLHVRLRVRDTGPGLSTEAAARVFHPTNIAEEASLGLPVVRAIVSAHGGATSIETSDTSPTFTQVTVWLPAAATLEIPPEFNESAPVARKLCIAVIDDEEALARATRRLLTGLGHEAAIHDAESLLRAVNDDPRAFDLIITDLTMPGLNGLQLAAELRRRSLRAPILIMTGHLTADISKTLDPISVLNKPFGRDELSAAISRLVS